MPIQTRWPIARFQSALTKIATQTVRDVGRVPIGPIVIATSEPRLVFAVGTLRFAQKDRQALSQIGLPVHSAVQLRPIGMMSLSAKIGPTFSPKRS